MSEIAVVNNSVTITVLFIPRTNMNTIASSLMLVASLFNVAVWVFCKDLPIFHDDNEKVKSGKGDKVEANGQVDISRDSVLVKKGENLEVF